MMDLDEAIQHCEEVADEKEEDAIIYHNCATYKQNLYEKGLAKNTEKECRACAEEHRQLAEWLKELKAYKKNTRGDAISRQAVLDALDNIKYSNEFCEEHHIDWSVNLSMVHIVVNQMPSVTPQQRTGMWIEHFDEIGKWYECDQCHTDWGGSVNYCPNCGAKMEVEE